MKQLYVSCVGKGAEATLARVLARFEAEDFDVLLVSYDGIDLRPFERPGLSVVPDPGFRLFQHLALLGARSWASYEHVFFWNDDIEPDDFDWRAYLDVHRRNRLELSQPATSARSQTSHDISRAWPGIGRLTDFVEIGLGSVFTAHAWSRFVRMCRRHENPYGWGYDIVARAVCGYERMGIIDKETVTHTRLDVHADPVRKAAESEAFIRSFGEVPRSSMRTLGPLE
jgi:hypothetical protein